MRLKFFTLLFLFVCFLNSCTKNFLEINDTTSLNRQNYVKDLSGVEEYLYGAYYQYTRNFENGFEQGYADLVADNAKPLASSPQLMLAHYSWAQLKDDRNEVTISSSVSKPSISMNGLWRTGYLIIRSCSFVIEEIDQYRNENPSKADNLKGQAFALRALVHSKLVNVFAQPYVFTDDASHLGIPYIEASDPLIASKRLAVKEVYNKIIKDYNKSLELLSESFTDTRYLTKPAVKGFLARTYLFKQDYAEAKKFALEICTQFPLLKISDGYPTGVFAYSTSKSKNECLFQLTPRSIDYVINYYGFWTRGAGLRFKATGDIAEILTENLDDARRIWVTKDAKGNWDITKFPTNVDATVKPAERSYYHPILRSSEMYLTVAEAAANTGDENTANAYLNQIRLRANPALSELTLSGQSLIDSIYKERRKELSFEGIRMFDLQRWKQAVHRKDALFPEVIHLPFGQNKSIAPIPPSDVRFGGIEQNPGY